METVIRVVVVYIAILAALRVLGKREFGELAPFDLLMLLLIPEFVSQGVIGSDYSLTTGVIAVATLLSLVFVTSVIAHRFKRLERWIEGEPTLLVAKGRLLDRNLNRERISPAEIYGAMRRAGLDNLERVRWAILETDGRIAIVPEESS